MYYIKLTAKQGNRKAKTYKPDDRFGSLEAAAEFIETWVEKQHRMIEQKCGWTVVNAERTGEREILATFSPVITLFEKLSVRIQIMTVA